MSWLEKLRRKLEKMGGWAAREICLCCLVIGLAGKEPSQVWAHDVDLHPSDASKIHSMSLLHFIRRNWMSSRFDYFSHIFYVCIFTRHSLINSDDYDFNGHEYFVKKAGIVSRNLDLNFGNKKGEKGESHGVLES